MDFNKLPENSMLRNDPSFFKEWNFERNKDLDIYKMTFKSGKKVWWKCELGHEWVAMIANRMIQKSGCPICNKNKKGRVTLKLGYNDMWTTVPDQAKLLLNPEDGYKYTRASSKRVDWKCPDCGDIIKNKSIWHIHQAGLYCPKCSDVTPFGERFIYHLLKNKGLSFKYDCAQEWSQRKRYDFYLTDYNWIIEVHGIQHYKQHPSYRFSERARSLEEEINNDELKKRLAIQNGVAEYIVLDARESTVEFLKNSIENSKLKELIGDADYKRIGKLSSKSFVKESCDLWGEGRTVFEISRTMGIHTSTIIRYLKRGNEVEWCNYSREEDYLRKGLKPTKNKKHKIVQLDKNGDYIASFNSITEAGKKLNINIPDISNCCRDIVDLAGGFKWVYEDEHTNESI